MNIRSKSIIPLHFMAFISAATLLSSCATAPPLLQYGGSQISKQKGYIIAATDESRWGCYAHPALFVMPDDKLLLQFNESVDRRGSPKARFISEDSGESWRRTGTQYYTIDDRKIRSFAMVVPEGPVWAVHDDKNGPGVSGYSVTRMVGSDENKKEHWKFVFPDVYVRLQLSPWFSREKDSGRIYATGRVDQRMTQTRIALLFSSADDGLHWQFVSEIADDNDLPYSQEGPTEPSVLCLGNNRLLVMLRTGHRFSKKGEGSAFPMALASSEDGGKTWAYTKTKLRGVRPKLIKLQDNTIVCAYGRPGNHLAFSTNMGRTWTKRTLTPDQHPTTGYCDMIEVSPGKLFVVYDQFDVVRRPEGLFGPVERGNAVFGRYIQVNP